MNQKIIKKGEEIERTKAKIAELQALLPELEREKTNMENNEIVRLVRSANVAPGEVAAFVEEIKKGRRDSRSHDGRSPGTDIAGNINAAPPAARLEDIENDKE